MAGIKLIAHADTPLFSQSYLRDYVRVDDEIDDILIMDMGKAATNIIASRIGITVSASPSTWRLALDQAPNSENPYIELLNPPIQSIDSVTTYSNDNTQSVVDPSNYYLDDFSMVPKLIFENYNFPSNLRAVNAVEVEYTAGYMSLDDIPEGIKVAISEFFAFIYEHKGDDETGIELRLTPAFFDNLRPYEVMRFNATVYD